MFRQQSSSQMRLGGSKTESVRKRSERERERERKGEEEEK